MFSHNITPSSSHQPTIIPVVCRRTSLPLRPGVGPDHWWSCRHMRVLHRVGGRVVADPTCLFLCCHRCCILHVIEMAAHNSVVWGSQERHTIVTHINDLMQFRGKDGIELVPGGIPSVDKLFRSYTLVGTLWLVLHLKTLRESGVKKSIYLKMRWDKINYKNYAMNTCVGSCMMDIF